MKIIHANTGLRILILSATFGDVKEASFIPVSRIMSRCAVIEQPILFMVKVMSTFVYLLLEEVMYSNYAVLYVHVYYKCHSLPFVYTFHLLWLLLLLLFCQRNYHHVTVKLCVDTKHPASWFRFL